MTSDDDEKESETFEAKEKKEEEKEENVSFSMNDSSLLLRYNTFTNQLMSSLYLLKCMGFDEINKESDDALDVKHEQAVMEQPWKWGHSTKNSQVVYWDDLFCGGFQSLVGLNNNNNKNNIKNSQLSMSCILDNIKLLISNKMCLSDDLLILCAIYCNHLNDESLFNLLISTTFECLNGKDEHFKTRNYQWFKHFILKSNVFFVKCKNSNQIFFDKIEDEVNKLLVKQQKYIWENIKKIEKQDKETNVKFEQLCKLQQQAQESKKSKNSKKMDSSLNSNIRQNKIRNGIVADVNQSKIIENQAAMATSHSLFDIQFENNTKSYLIKCLSFAHSNNNRFQKQMKQYFTNELKIQCKYASAPVKLYDRCVIKATSDYGEKEYPSAANILDYLRFSVTFDNVTDLFDGLNVFLNDIEKGDVIECLLPSVLRIKNGFSDILTKWKSYEDASYVDIKFNLIYTNEDKSESMIVEAQFLLSFLLKAKKMGHKYYSIIRQKEFVDNIKNQCYNIDGNYEKYKGKILKMVENHDRSQLIKQLFWKPHLVLSVIYAEKGYDTERWFHPLFVLISQEFLSIDSKFVLFFLNC